MCARACGGPGDHHHIIFRSPCDATPLQAMQHDGPGFPSGAGKWRSTIQVGFFDEKQLLSDFSEPLLPPLLAARQRYGRGHT